MKYESELMQHKSKGIRIYDLDERGVVEPQLMDFLVEVPNGESYSWSILFLDARGNLGTNMSIVDFIDKINNSKDGFEISWVDLNLLASKFNELMEIMIIGCKDKIFLHRYEDDCEMYESCDITIEKIHCACWEVFSKDESLINRLKLKFKETELLEPDFLK